MTDVSFLTRKRTKLYRQAGSLGPCSPRFNASFMAVLLRAVLEHAGQRIVLHAGLRVRVFIDWLRTCVGHRSGESLPPDSRRCVCLPIV
jgi:hypothetical protein